MAAITSYNGVFPSLRARASLKQHDFGRSCVHGGVFPGLRARASLKLQRRGQARQGRTVFPPSCPGLIEAPCGRTAVRCARPIFPGLRARASLKLDRGLVGRHRKVVFPGLRARALLKLSLDNEESPGLIEAQQACCEGCRNGTTFPGAEHDPDHGSAPRAPIGWRPREGARRARRRSRTAASTWMRHWPPDEGRATEARPRAASRRWRRRRRR